MSAAGTAWADGPDDGLSFVGRPESLYRTTSALYADQARLDWNAYVCATLAGSQRAGGRFNPKGEFGALYTSEDEATAWAEAAARYRREGVLGLPQSMHLIRIVVEAGRFADLTEESVRSDFQIDRESLEAEDPTEGQKEACLKVARAVRAVADFLASPSARGAGSNVPLYPDRTDSELRTSFVAAVGGRVPNHLAQRAAEAW